ncbi:hypothetical protein RFI_18465, partial [Reticulomyxa filosa]
ISFLASNLVDLLKSEVTSNKSSKYEPRPLHSIYLKIINLKSPQDQQQVEQVGISVKGVISVSASLQTQSATFYCTSNDLKKKIIHALRAKGFQVQDDNSDKVWFILYFSLSFLCLKKKKKKQNDSKSTTSNVSSLASERQDLSSLKYTPNRRSGPSYAHSHSHASKTAITKYQPDPSVKTLSQRLEEEKKQKEEEEKEQQQTQSLLSKVVGYIW